MKDKDKIIREIEQDIIYLSKVIDKLTEKAGVNTKIAILEFQLMKEKLRKRLIEIKNSDHDLFQEDPIEDIKDSLNDIWVKLKKRFDKFMDEI
ncbi:hypothetical protein SAMN05661008_00212 [Alkalithermobacter thermoalcaliphilus JW-YL-7 = DSM 7308]|uniref:Uncharacterized protein n=1 Tax=Alkalithermobacter thermoalcaliphilus JW-YL-7 = DSM 7308 TaxID=1121328 RepID=A0A150FRL4_CLOPD|nr:hypothetical protein JWYL7_1311 [[Clostridium] paradoxum JW-YL-7 = DSM 7308]SHK41571.1 hypothetical protein SAMN05661008_00212 [[Clostridium] paradoxum JW-YL-7 = DSM 7308]